MQCFLSEREDEEPVTEETTKDFFISYNKADRGLAEWIAWQLEAEGYKRVLQAWDFRPGGNFVLQMQEAVRTASLRRLQDLQHLSCTSL
jgi:TIR domain